MLDRREFLTKSAATGVALAGGSLLHVPAALGSTAKGYAVGNKALKIAGLEQYEGKTTLSKLHHRWVLLDVCAVWCGPCNGAAEQYAPLVAEANEKGVPLSVLTVLREGSVVGKASTRTQADSWAIKYGYERESVLHCGGSVESPLFKLVEEISAANGVEVAFPCHLLIDPKGVVRYFQQGADTEKLKTELAKLSGVPLSGVYEELPFVNPPKVESATFSFGVQGKGTVAETLAVGQKSANCTLSVQEGNGRAVAFLTLAAGTEVDLSTPISITLQTNPLRTYLEAVQPGESYFPLGLWDGTPEEGFANNVAVGGRNSVIDLADGSGSGISPVSQAQLVHGEGLGEAWGQPANVIELELSFQTTPAPYARSLQLSEQLAGEGGSKTAQKLLVKARKDMAHHNFAAATTELTDATGILGFAGDIARHVAWLAKT
ncbi:MAG TPA: twin-arginine translocation signal domain-containing protein [Solirubrobacteraceae bacterium]|jgi:thiol-disulfide isomerase/thioredoxin|nr:twin-arginine translocation signal domain-containing protein [Solirubrobacteraceae bacterium]